MLRNHWTLRAVVAACTIAWLAAGQQAAAAIRPVNLVSETQVIGDPFSADGADLVVTGQGTPVGQYTGTGEVIHRHVGSGQISLGSVSLKAANGDRLNMSFFAVWDQATGVRSGPVLIYGGTGRYANAIGLAFITARPVRPGVVAFDIVGVVDY
jgi:hypothetical protein